jgi:hypothetical protein
VVAHGRTIRTWSGPHTTAFDQIFCSENCRQLVKTPEGSQVERLEFRRLRNNPFLFLFEGD